MILLERTDRRTLQLRFDFAGAAELRQLCIQARIDPAAAAAITLDSRVFTHGREHKELPADLMVGVLAEDVEPSLHRPRTGTVRLELPADILDYLAVRLEECASTGHFWPPEWTSVREGDSRRSSDVHCILTP